MAYIYLVFADECFTAWLIVLLLVRGNMVINQ